MATVVLTSPGTIADDSSFGSVAWSNPGNAASSNNSYATASISTGSNSHYLKFTNWGASIPTGATINGITVEIEVSCVFTPGISVNDVRCRLVKAGTIQSTDRNSVTGWTTTDTYLSHGGSSDLWGGTWLDTDINNSGFGFVIAALQNGGPVTAQIDHARITIDYTPAAGVVLTQLERDVRGLHRGLCVGVRCLKRRRIERAEFIGSRC